LQGNELDLHLNRNIFCFAKKLTSITAADSAGSGRVPRPQGHKHGQSLKLEREHIAWPGLRPLLTAWPPSHRLHHLDTKSESSQKAYTRFQIGFSTIMNQRLIERSRDFLFALSRLEEAVAQPESSLLRDAVIQRFRLTYELAWKAVELWLETKDIVELSAKEILQQALQQGLLDDGNSWSELHRLRNLTSCTYDEAQAIKVYDFVKTQGIQLFAQLAEKVRAWTI
jgi:nucleotidyltransferase substrate binding protein (TIGR01987 family)